MTNSLANISAFDSLYRTDTILAGSAQFIDFCVDFIHRSVDITAFK